MVMDIYGIDIIIKYMGPEGESSAEAEPTNDLSGLSDRAIRNTRESFERLLESTREQYMLFASQNSDDPKVKAFVAELQETIASSIAGVAPFIAEEERRLNKGISIPDIQRTQEEVMAMAKRDAELFDTPFLRQSIRSLREKMAKRRTALDRIAEYRPQARELGMMGMLEDLNAKFIEYGRDMSHDEIALGIYEAEVESRLPVAYKAGRFVARFLKKRSHTPEPENPGTMQS